MNWISNQTFGGKSKAALVDRCLWSFTTHTPLATAWRLIPTLPSPNHLSKTRTIHFPKRGSKDIRSPPRVLGDDNIDDENAPPPQYRDPPHLLDPLRPSAPIPPRQGKEGGEPLPPSPRRPLAPPLFSSLLLLLRAIWAKAPEGKSNDDNGGRGKEGKEREEEETLLKDLPFLPPSVRPSDYLDLSLVWVGGIREKDV